MDAVFSNNGDLFRGYWHCCSMRLRSASACSRKPQRTQRGEGAAPELRGEFAIGLESGDITSSFMVGLQLVVISGLPILGRSSHDRKSFRTSSISFANDGELVVRRKRASSARDR